MSVGKKHFLQVAARELTISALLCPSLPRQLLIEQVLANECCQSGEPSQPKQVCVFVSWLLASLIPRSHIPGVRRRRRRCSRSNLALTLPVSVDSTLRFAGRLCCLVLAASARRIRSVVALAHRQNDFPRSSQCVCDTQGSVVKLIVVAGPYGLH